MHVVKLRRRKEKEGEGLGHSKKLTFFWPVSRLCDVSLDGVLPLQLAHVVDNLAVEVGEVGGFRGRGAASEKNIEEILFPYCKTYFILHE